MMDALLAPGDNLWNAVRHFLRVQQPCLHSMARDPYMRNSSDTVCGNSHALMPLSHTLLNLYVYRRQCLRSINASHALATLPACPGRTLWDLGRCQVSAHLALHIQPMHAGAVSSTHLVRCRHTLTACHGTYACMSWSIFVWHGGNSHNTRNPSRHSNSPCPCDLRLACWPSAPAAGCTQRLSKSTCACMSWWISLGKFQDPKKVFLQESYHDIRRPQLQAAPGAPC